MPVREYGIFSGGNIFPVDFPVKPSITFLLFTIAYNCLEINLNFLKILGRSVLVVRGHELWAGNEANNSVGTNELMLEEERK